MGAVAYIPVSYPRSSKWTCGATAYRSGKLSLENPEPLDLLTYIEFFIIMMAKDPIYEIFTFTTALPFPE
jgi:hypothetical protein